LSSRLRALKRRAQATLVPRLAAQMRRDARRRAAAGTSAARRVEFGAFEGARCGLRCVSARCAASRALALTSRVAQR